jgi:hypothetical protein
MASITASVMTRRARPAGMPAYAPGSMGGPKRTVTLARRGTLLPMGCTASVPMRPTGTTGTPAVRASQATPVRPL